MKAFPRTTLDAQPAQSHVQHTVLNGELVPWTGPTMEVYSPSMIDGPDGPQRVCLGTIPRMDSAASLLALDAAEQAFENGLGAWPSASMATRVEAVEAFIKAMVAVREDVVNLLMWEIGKVRPDAEKEFDRTVDYLRDTIQSVKAMEREAIHFREEGGFLAQVRRVPLGVALIMGPYNYPLNETFTTLFPALLMGNTVVFKPAKYGVLLITPLMEAFSKCFPAGVVNIILGRGRETVSAIMETGRIHTMAFIGTHKGASDLKRLHPHPHRLRAVLGLDAKNPGIVLGDANLELATSQALAGSLSFNGQRCTALKILWVQKGIHDAFVEKLAAGIESLPWGLPWENGSKITALPEDGKTAYLDGLVQDALSKGAKIANPSGGQFDATFFAPTLLTGVTKEMRIYHEEQFGPVVPVVAFENFQEPIQYGVESPYGQQVSLFTQNPAALGRLVDVFVQQVGRVNINSQCQRGPDTFPFNGRKDSAEGTLSVYDALRAFSIRSLVTFPTSSDQKSLVTDVLSQRSSQFLSTDFYL